MIDCLYQPFKHWANNKAIWIYSDTHFEDSDCHLMDSNWITPTEQIKILNSQTGRKDTLILLGDIGNPEWLNKLHASYKILITGNHDKGTSIYKSYFDEIYNGPLLIADKILLSHEPINGLDWCINIHGHDHGSNGGRVNLNHYCVCSNTVQYKALNLNSFIKNGGLAHIPSIHRLTINYATEHSLHKEVDNG